MGPGGFADRLPVDDVGFLALYERLIWADDSTGFADLEPREARPVASLRCFEAVES